MYVVSTVNEYNDYNLVAIYQHFEGQLKNFVSTTFKVPLVLHSQLYFLYHTHNTSLLIDKYGPSCHIPAAPITKIDVCYMTDVKSISDK